MKYVIYQADDAAETGMTSLARWEEGLPEICLDANGAPMKAVKEFEAVTWNEAMQAYYDHYGYGKYNPVES